VHQIFRAPAAIYEPPAQQLGVPALWTEVRSRWREAVPVGIRDSRALGGDLGSLRRGPRAPAKPLGLEAPIHKVDIRA